MDFPNDGRVSFQEVIAAPGARTSAIVFRLIALEQLGAPDAIGVLACF